MISYLGGPVLKKNKSIPGTYRKEEVQQNKHEPHSPKRLVRDSPRNSLPDEASGVIASHDPSRHKVPASFVVAALMVLIELVVVRCVPWSAFCIPKQATAVTATATGTPQERAILAAQSVRAQETRTKQRFR